MSTFADLRLNEPILKAVTAEGYTTPTPIQAKAIPVILEGKDLCGVAQTGTGKTAAFALPIIQLLGHHHTPGPRCLVLSPTRELAAQISDSFRVYGKNAGLSRTVIFGGVGYRPQIEAIKRGVDILIATPGRLMDLMQQGACDLSHVNLFVLDEADRMLDMGFIHDIRKIVAKLPPKRQSLFFSATMPRDIRQLADSILKHPVTVEVAPQSSAAETVEQSVYFLPRTQKPRMLLHLLEKQPATDRVLIFTRTKHGADKVAKGLERHGYPAQAIHGNLRQNARMKAMDAFRKGHAPVLVATDVASRGIDIDEIELVINYEIPNVPETYVHRIGRTGRAGASGKAVSLCDFEEKGWLRDIERLMKRQVPVLKLPALGDMPAVDPKPVHPAHKPHYHKGPVTKPAHAPAVPEHAARADRGGHGVRPAHAAPKHDHHSGSAQAKPHSENLIRTSKSQWHKEAGTEPAYQDARPPRPPHHKGKPNRGGHGKPMVGGHLSDGRAYGGSNTQPGGGGGQHNQRDHSGQSGGSHGRKGARAGGGHGHGGGGHGGGYGGGYGAKGRGKKGGKRFGSR